MSNVSSSNGLEKYPKLRFKGFADPWTVMKLSDFTMRIMRKNTTNVTDIPLTISSKDGLINQNDFFNKQVASKDMSGYYLLHHGEYAYNKSYSVGYDFGSIKRLEKYDMGALSTLYICFALTKFNSDFIKHYFDSLKWYREIYMISAEGARNHGLLNVPTEDFFATLHTLPIDEAEQEKIASFLDALTERIEKQRSLVENLKKYKRGFLRGCFSNQSGWDVLPISSIGKVVTGSTPPTDNPKNYGGNKLFCAPSDVGTEKYISSTIKRVSEKGFHTGRIVPKGTIIVTCIGLIGKLGIAMQDMITNQQINSLIVDDVFDNEFVYYALEYALPRYAAQASMQTMPILSKSEFEKITLPIPDIKRQKDISKPLALLDNKIFAETEILEKLTSLKNGLLQKLFI